MHRPVGFTLLEVLIATAIVAVLSLALYTSLYTAHKAQQTARAAIAPIRAADHALDVMGAAIETALPATGILAGLFEGEDDMTRDGLDSDIMRFYTNQEPVEPLDDTATASDVRKVEFLLTESSDGTSLTLVRASTYNLLATVQPQPANHVLCRNVRSLNFSYYDGIEWVDEWDSSTRDNALPFAVRITLSIDKPQRRTNLQQSPDDESTLYQLSRLIRPACAVEPDETRILQ